MNATGTTLTCGTCQEPLPEAFYNAAEMQPCLKCRTMTLIKVFPSRFRAVESIAGESVSLEGEAVCFFHDKKAAVVACDACGRFLCRLCDCDMGNQHLCASCLASIRTTTGLHAFKSKYPRYDHIAFGLATYGLLASVPTLFLTTLATAPMAMYLVARHWREPISIVPCSRFKMAAAFVFAGLQLMAWAVGLYLLLVKVFTSW